MINHHFGGKQGLLEAIIQQFSTELFEVPLRLIADRATSADTFELKFTMFVSESLEALAAQRDVFKIIANGDGEFIPFTSFRAGFTRFAEAAKQDGILRSDIDVEILIGMVLDRLGNQVLYSNAAKAPSTPNAITDKDYRRKWLDANIAIWLHGIVR